MSAQAELDELLSLDPAGLIDRQRHRFDRLAAPFETQLVLCGAAKLGRLTLAGLRRAGIEPLAFADNSESLQGTEVDGVRVHSVSDAVAHYDKRATFVITVWGGDHRQKPLRSQLQYLGCQRIVSYLALFNKQSDVFLPFYSIDEPHLTLAEAARIQSAFSLMADEPSRHEFVAQVRRQLQQDLDCLPLPLAEEQYFCDALFRPAEHEVVIDCGAYDGDTLRVFLNRQGDDFEHYIAIEPDPINFARLQDFVATLLPRIAARVGVLQQATGDRRSTVAIDPTGSVASTIGSGTVKVDCVPLDELPLEHAPTMIKMDIEGAEYDSLKGAGRLVRAHAPLLAIYAYHRADHLWSIPLLMQAQNRHYQIFLRRYHEGWELVCYAVPPERRARERL
jgi:FkbM family methyltransferase